MIRRERFSSSSDPYWTLNEEGRKLVNQRVAERYSAFRMTTLYIFYSKVTSPTPLDLEKLERFLDNAKRRMRREESRKLLHYNAYMWEQKHGTRKKFSKENYEKVRGFKYRPVN